MENTIFIYTDGACSGNPGNGGWAAVIIYPENRLIELGGGESDTTNNRMEMTAAISALECIKNRNEKIKIYSDSSLLINGITKWIYSWKKKNWITSQGNSVANKDLWEKIYKLIGVYTHKIEWIHVKGHAGHEINERCDQIAVAFSKRTKINLYDGPAIGCGYSLLELTAPVGTPRKSSSQTENVDPEKEKNKIYISVVNSEVCYHKEWKDCQKRVSGKSGARFKKVYSEEQAEEQLKLWEIE